MPDKLAGVDILLHHVADKPLPLVRLAQILHAKGQLAHARELCAAAVAMAPNSGEVHALAAEVFSQTVPTFYWSLLRHGHRRHQIYETVFRRAIRPHSHVLDIGSGTGLFAMLAARAGAAEVIACEANPAVAEVVSEIVALNNLADRVRVVAKRSSDLEIGVDLNAHVDVVIWDNLSRTLIGAGALPTVEQAVRRLMRPGGQIIPARGAIRIALAEHHNPQWQMGIVEGFDLSPFNRLAPPCYHISYDNEPAMLRSDIGDLFHFDFGSGGPFPQGRAAVTLSALGGRVNGIVQLVYLELDGELSDQFPIVEKTSVSGAMFYPLVRPIETAPGDRLKVCGSHDRLSLRIWVDIS